MKTLLSFAILCAGTTLLGQTKPIQTCGTQADNGCPAQTKPETVCGTGLCADYPPAPEKAASPPGTSITPKPKRKAKPIQHPATTDMTPWISSGTGSLSYGRTVICNGQGDGLCVEDEPPAVTDPKILAKLDALRDGCEHLTNLVGIVGLIVLWSVRPWKK